MSLVVPVSGRNHCEARKGVMLDNLARVSREIIAHPFSPFDVIDGKTSAYRDAQDLRTMAAEPGDDFAVDRSLSEILVFFGKTPQEIEEHLIQTPGMYVDIGIGRSSAIDTVAEFFKQNQLSQGWLGVDIHQPHVNYQLGRGIPCIHMKGSDILGDSDEEDVVSPKAASASLVIAHNSVSLYPVFDFEAANSARTIINLLCVGGIALVGAIMHGKDHNTYENLLAADKLFLVADQAKEAYMAYLRGVFCHEIIAAMENGIIQVAGIRNPSSRWVLEKKLSTNTFLPTHLVIQKVSESLLPQAETSDFPTHAI